MSTAPVHARPRSASPALLLTGLLAAVALCLLAVAVGATPVSTTQWFGVGVAAVAVLALTLWNYEAAAALGFVLLAIVRFEPAPVDGVFLLVIAVAVVTGRLDLRAVPLWVSAAIAGYVAMNLLSSVEATKPGRAVTFMAITVYLLALAVWTAGFVNSRRRARLLLVCFSRSRPPLRSPSTSRSRQRSPAPST